MSKKEDCYTLINKVTSLKQYFESADEKLSAAIGFLESGVILNGKAYGVDKISNYRKQLDTAYLDFQGVSEACHRIIKNIEAMERNAELAQKNSTITSTDSSEISHVDNRLLERNRAKAMFK